MRPLPFARLIHAARHALLGGLLCLTGAVAAQERPAATGEGAPRSSAVPPENAVPDSAVLAAQLKEERGKDGGPSLLDLPLEALAAQPVRTGAPLAFQQEVTTVERSASTLGRSPAAVFVVISEMIRRSGATSIPEALRLVPGVQVARIDAHTWAISARGFNDCFANKLLVQIDGRVVYNPIFSGTFWDEFLGRHSARRGAARHVRHGHGAVVGR